ncbi:MAG: DUF3108 domain-containing protein [candidate division KSB1 bacterium]|nr:DUF3108 domain-containing protein [candidate division KSB1 bacterium]MDZ7368691.1 DUF3108 domain-containing protein [candidate division KSB1 bacterium]MDZ7406568.1 DUF3108 domain-containing protein [candidate division KSB1 bacterium]
MSHFQRTFPYGSLRRKPLWFYRSAISVLLIVILPSAVLRSQQTRSDSIPTTQPGILHTRTNTPVDSTKTEAGRNGVAPPLRVVPNAAFGLGEKLTFLVHYGPVNAGNARLSIPEIVTVNGRPCYKIISEMWSNKLFSSFFKIDDRVESHTDVDGLFSWRFSKRLHEGDYKTEHEVAFDQINHLAVMTKDGKNDTLAVPPFVQDVLSAIYLLRTMKLAPGDTIHIDNHSDGKLFDLQVVIHKREKVHTKAGKFSCLVVEPFLKTSALFQQKGRLVIHMTDDHRKMPVMITSQLYVKGFKLGAIVAELEKIEGVKGY